MPGTYEVETAATLRADAGEDTLLTPQDAARLLKVSVSWVYEHVRPEAEDRLPFVKLGKYLASIRATSAPTSTPNARAFTARRDRVDC